jgi:hypothetical protein
MSNMQILEADLIDEELKDVNVLVFLLYVARNVFQDIKDTGILLLPNTWEAPQVISKKGCTIFLEEWFGQLH